MASFFPKSKLFNRRTSLELFFIMLSLLNEKPRSKFALMCALETNSPTISRVLAISDFRGLTDRDEKKVLLTVKGKKLLEAWRIE